MRIGQAVLGALDASSLDPLASIGPQLVLAFGAPVFFEDPRLPSFLGEAFPGAACLGCSTAGEVSRCSRSPESEGI